MRDMGKNFRYMYAVSLGGGLISDLTFSPFLNVLAKFPFNIVETSLVPHINGPKIPFVPPCSPKPL